MQITQIANRENKMHPSALTSSAGSNVHPVFSFHAYYKNNITSVIAEVLNFFSYEMSPDIITIGRSSPIDIAVLRREYPRAHLVAVEDEFEGYQVACRIARSSFNCNSLIVANDSLQRHWKLTSVRRRWLQAARRQAEKSPCHVVVSEHNVGNPKVFPANSGFGDWFTSNYFLTNAADVLEDVLFRARQAGESVPPHFFESGIGDIKKQLKRRNSAYTEDRIQNKIRRIYIEMNLSCMLRSAGIQVVAATEAQSLMNILHRKIVDK